MNDMSVKNISGPEAGTSGKYDLENLPKEITDLLKEGRFAEYHMEKARIALAVKDFPSAKYQIAASFRHGSSPEARELRAEIRRQARAARSK